MRVYTLSDMRSEKKLRVYTASEAKGLTPSSALHQVCFTVHSPEDDQSILIDTSSCSSQPVLFTTIHSSNENFYMVSPQTSLYVSQHNLAIYQFYTLPSLYNEQNMTKRKLNNFVNTVLSEHNSDIFDF